MIFEDSKQIRFRLTDIGKTEANDVVAGEGQIYLESTNGKKLIEQPIYTFKSLSVTERI